MAQQDMYFVDGADVEAVLGTAGRAYLVGHLARPQVGLEHVGSLETDIEVGTTRYDVPTADAPHVHEWNVDITVVLRGSYAVRNLRTGEVRVPGPGGTCIIEPGTPHVCVAGADTQVLFVKMPGSNDKRDVKLSEEAQTWVDAALRGSA